MNNTTSETRLLSERFGGRDFCQYCGERHLLHTSWPRSCPRCKRKSHLNPLPVGVALQPVGDGLLAVRRAINPACGQLALPGGYVELGEDWRGAIVRELSEETGVRAVAGQVVLFDVRTAADGTLGIFGILPPISAIPMTVVNEEVSGVTVIDEPARLAFSDHREVAAAYFEGAI